MLREDEAASKQTLMGKVMEREQFEQMS